MQNKVALFILVVLAVGIGTYFWYQLTPSSSSTVDELTFLSTEVSLSYNDFLKGLERDCPYYEPNGARYRECLVTLLEKRDQEVDKYQADLIRDIKAITDSEFQTARQTFIVDLARLNNTWLTYRDQLCTVQADLYWGGSDQGGELNRCRLFETARYRLLLENLRNEWMR